MAELRAGAGIEKDWDIRWSDMKARKTAHVRTEQVVRRTLRLKKKIMSNLSRELSRSEQIAQLLDIERAKLIAARLERFPTGPIWNISLSLAALSALDNDIVSGGLKSSREKEIQDRLRLEISELHSQIRALEKYQAKL